MSEVTRTNSKVMDCFDSLARQATHVSGISHALLSAVTSEFGRDSDRDVQDFLLTAHHILADAAREIRTQAQRIIETSKTS